MGINKKKIISVLNFLFIPSLILLLVVGSVLSFNYIQHKRMTEVIVQIDSYNGKYFINKRDVEKIVSNQSTEPLTDKNYDEIFVSKIENKLEKNPFILNAEVTKYMNGLVKIRINQRVPIARVFLANGSTYYLDSSAVKMPFSYNYAAKVPVFTVEMDSALSFRQLNIKNKCIVKLSISLSEDSLMNSFIGSINMNTSNEFQLFPKLGSFNINFGDSSLCSDKVKRLKLFVSKSLAKEGWNKYVNLSLKFKGQIVASKN